MTPYDKHCQTSCYIKTAQDPSSPKLSKGACAVPEATSQARGSPRRPAAQAPPLPRGVLGAQLAFCACVRALTPPLRRRRRSHFAVASVQVVVRSRGVSEKGRDRGRSSEGCALRQQATEVGRGKTSSPPAGAARGPAALQPAFVARRGRRGRVGEGASRRAACRDCGVRAARRTALAPSRAPRGLRRLAPQFSVLSPKPPKQTLFLSSAAPGRCPTRESGTVAWCSARRRTRPGPFIHPSRRDRWALPAGTAKGAVNALGAALRLPHRAAVAVGVGGKRRKTFAGFHKEIQEIRCRKGESCLGWAGKACRRKETFDQTDVAHAKEKRN